MNNQDPLLTCDISVRYPRTGAGVQGVHFSVSEGEILGIAGESGSGKSTIASAVLGLTARKGGNFRGSVVFRGRELAGLPERELRRYRGREIAFVSQSSVAALNPALRLRTQFREVWRAHRTEGDWLDVAGPILDQLKVPPTDEFLNRYPSQLSVGIAQRVLIALALLHRPALLIADEPTSALDLVTQEQVLKLFFDLRNQQGMSILFISHDLLALTAVSDRIAVLQKGSLVEVVDGPGFLTSARHPYTRELVRALCSISSAVTTLP